MGYLRLEEAWQMVRHYFPGVAITAAQVSIDSGPATCHHCACTMAKSQCECSTSVLISSDMSVILILIPLPLTLTLTLTPLALALVGISNLVLSCHSRAGVGLQRGFR